MLTLIHQAYGSPKESREYLAVKQEGDERRVDERYRAAPCQDQTKSMQ